MKRILLSIIALVVVACGKNENDKGLDAIFDEGVEYIDYFFAEPDTRANNQEVTCIHYGNLDKRNLVSIYGAAPYELIEETEFINSDGFAYKAYPIALFKFKYRNGEFIDLQRIDEWFWTILVTDTIKIDGTNRFLSYNTCIDTRTYRNKSQGWFYYEQNEQISDKKVVSFDGGIVNPECAYDSILSMYLPSSTILDRCKELNEGTTKTNVVAAQFRYIVTDRGQKISMLPLTDWEIKEVQIDTITDATTTRVYVNF